MVFFSSWLGVMIGVRVDSGGIVIVGLLMGVMVGIRVGSGNLVIFELWMGDMVGIRLRTGEGEIGLIVSPTPAPSIVSFDPPTATTTATITTTATTNKARLIKHTNRMGRLVTTALSFPGATPVDTDS
jgi:hypothetical protein